MWRVSKRSPARCWQVSGDAESQTYDPTKWRVGQTTPHNPRHLPARHQILIDLTAHQFLVKCKARPVADKRNVSMNQSIGEALVARTSGYRPKTTHEAVLCKDFCHVDIWGSSPPRDTTYVREGNDDKGGCTQNLRERSSSSLTEVVLPALLATPDTAGVLRLVEAAECIGLVRISGKTSCAVCSSVCAQSAGCLHVQTALVFATYHGLLRHRLRHFQ